MIQISAADLVRTLGDLPNSLSKDMDKGVTFGMPACLAPESCQEADQDIISGRGDTGSEPDHAFCSLDGASCIECIRKSDKLHDGPADPLSEDGACLQTEYIIDDDLAVRSPLPSVQQIPGRRPGLLGDR